MAADDGGCRMSARPGPRSTGERLRRLLVVLPWLMERGRASLAETADTFGMTEAELVKDLELVAMCGLPPYLDECVDVFIDDDGMVEVGVPRFFVRPLRLTAPEAFALVTAGRAALELQGADPAGPLARALAKLERVLGEDGMVLDLDPPEATAVLTEAAEASVAVDVEYWSASSDEVTSRRIVPRTVFTDRGRWYVSADDDRSGELRHFRIDRIRSIERTDDRRAPRHVDPPVGDRWFADTPGLPTVTVRLGPSARWVAERFPVRAHRETDDGTEIDLVVASDRWLRRLLLRLGTTAEVIAPPAWRTVAAEEAKALLASRYAAD